MSDQLTSQPTNQPIAEVDELHIRKLDRVETTFKSQVNN